MNRPADAAAAHLTNFIRNFIEADLAGGKYAARAWGGHPGLAATHAGAPPDPAKIRTRFPPEPNGLPAFRPRQVDLPQLRPRARLRRRLPHALRRHQSGKGRAGVRRFHTRCGALAGFWLERQRHRAPVPRERLLRGHVPGGGIPGHFGPCLRRRTKRRGTARHARHADRARPSSPWRDRPAAESLARLREMRAGKYADGSMVLRAKIDMRSPNINLRDPAIYRIKRSDAPPHRRCVVHLSDVRLRPPDRGCAGTNHPLDLHPGIRGPATVLRLAARAPGRRRADGPPLAAAARIRAAQPHLRRAVQAQADPAGGGEARRGLGRSAPADAGRPRAGAATRPRASAGSPNASACPNPIPGSTTACSRNACASTSTKSRRGAPPCSIR